MQKHSCAVSAGTEAGKQFAELPEDRRGLRTGSRTPGAETSIFKSGQQSLTDRPSQRLLRIIRNAAVVGKALEGGRTCKLNAMLFCVLREKYRQLFTGNRGVRKEEAAAGPAGQAHCRRPLHRVGIIRAGRHIPERISTANGGTACQIVQDRHDLAAGRHGVGREGRGAGSAEKTVLVDICHRVVIPRALGHVPERIAPGDGGGGFVLCFVAARLLSLF